MRPFEVVYALAQTKSRNTHAEILSSLPKDHEFWTGVAYGLDPFRTFGVKDLPDPETYTASGAPFSMFKILADKLANRELTGHAARDAILAFANRCSELEWTFWYKKLLGKDLKCGVGISSINKYIPNPIYVWECQLAAPMAKCKNEKLPTEGIAEAKYDGVRTQFFLYPDASFDCYSRNGKLFHNFDAIGHQLAVLANYPGFPKCGLVIDGEVVSAANFNTLQSEMRGEDATFEGLFMAFDTLTIDEFKARQSDIPLRQRREVLRGLVNYVEAHNDDCWVHLSYGLDNLNAQTDQEQIMAFFEQQVQAGFEGIIVKNLNATYQFGRTNDWLKVKPTDTYDMVVEEVIEGEDRLVGTCGALVVSMTHEDKFVRTNVGSGMDDALRAWIWAHRDQMVGQVFEIMADSISTNRKGTHSLRFPRVIKHRPDLSETTVGA
jgi:DNA ligase-1